MKKSLLLFAVLFVYATKAQTYIPLPLDTNHYWSEYFTGWNGPQTLFAVAYKYKIKDTVVASTNYKKVFAEAISSSSNSYPAENNILIRQDSIQKKVYVLINGQEYFLYNFGKTVGDTLKVCDIYGGIPSVVTRTLIAIDSVFLSDNKYHKRYKYFAGAALSVKYVIEGVGGEHGFLVPYYIPLETGRELICLKKNYPSVSTIYLSPNFAQAGCTPNIMGFTPIIHSRAFSSFPNPVKEKLFINGDANYTFLLFDLVGKEIQIEQTDQKTLNLSSLSKGLYFLKVFDGNQYMTTEKILKE